MQPRVLIVNDEADLLEACSLILQSAGYTVETLLEGPKTAEQVARFAPDVLLLDWVLGKKRKASTSFASCEVDSARASASSSCRPCRICAVEPSTSAPTISCRSLSMTNDFFRSSMLTSNAAIRLDPSQDGAIDKRLALVQRLRIAAFPNWLFTAHCVTAHCGC